MNEELAWAAGFFDGEGCTSIHWNQNPGLNAYPLISIQQNDPAVLQRFRVAVGDGHIYGPQRRGNRNPYWQYEQSGVKRVWAIIRKLYPWLGNLKRDQAARALAQHYVHRAGKVKR